MVGRTIGQKVGQWATNIKTIIALMITILPIIGGSIAYFQHENIKKAIEPEITAEVMPEIEAPQIEKSIVEHIETVVKVKDYDLEIKRLFEADKTQAEDYKNQYQKIVVLELENYEQQKQIDAIKKWIGFSD